MNQQGTTDNFHNKNEEEAVPTNRQTAVDEIKKSNYKLSLFKTLWAYTYRGTITDALGEYTATVRVIQHIPLSDEDIPQNAPQVYPYLTVLVEDMIIQPKEIIDFETIFAPILMEKCTTPTFHPHHCFFFYPSPIDLLKNP